MLYFCKRYNIMTYKNVYSKTCSRRSSRDQLRRERMQTAENVLSGRTSYAGIEKPKRLTHRVYLLVNIIFFTFEHNPTGNSFVTFLICSEWKSLFLYDVHLNK